MARKQKQNKKQKQKTTTTTTKTKQNKTKTKQKKKPKKKKHLSASILFSIWRQNKQIANHMMLSQSIGSLSEGVPSSESQNQYNLGELGMLQVS